MGGGGDGLLCPLAAISPLHQSARTPTTSGPQAVPPFAKPEARGEGRPWLSPKASLCLEDGHLFVLTWPLLSVCP